MEGVRFDFACELAFLQVSDQFEEIDLVDSFTREEVLIGDYAVGFLFIVSLEFQYW